jgi:hypothetical protein
MRNDYEKLGHRQTKGLRAKTADFKANNRRYEHSRLKSAQ